ncbi:MAG TPA: class I SAM-dependent methyltransferase [Candidatus Methanoperedens sp.]
MDEDIDVEGIMRQIRENIKKKKGSSEDRAIEDSFRGQLDSPAQFTLEDNLDYLGCNWDLKADYNISTHRPIIGKPLVWSRQLIHGEVRRYVDLLVAKQSKFNYNVSCAMAAMEKDFDIKIKEAIDSKVNQIVAAMNKDIENKAWLAGLLEERARRRLTEQLPERTDNAMNYFVFEEKYRGSVDEIKKRHLQYLEYFKNCRNVLDIGCGRGEFLSLLKEKAIGSRGIDIDEDMVLYSQKIGLDVQKIDALSYLEKLENKSLDGIFSAQLIEHLTPADLISLIKLSYDKLQYGSYFIAETINPLCVVAFRAFIMDLSHSKFMHPETLKFLLESVGFRNIEFKFFSQVPEEARLKKVDLSNVKDEEKANFDLINRNIDNLNQLLYGYQDYAIIGKK